MTSINEAPNVVVVLIDDMGFSAPSAFGGPCRMPTADKLSERGLRYSRFHTTGICSPTRAALLTGRNHHAVGMGYLTDMATPRPGYCAKIPESAAAIPKLLRERDYASAAFGKMHETPREEVSPVGPFDRWPTRGLGFDKFYGFMGGEMNQWYPALFDGTTPVRQPKRPDDGYHFSEDMIDRAIDWVRDLKTLDPGKPFFCYLPFGATHAPFHVPKAWLDRYEGDFEYGWDEQRERTLTRQKALGIVPKETALTPWAPGVPHWNELSPVDQAAAARLMELYASFAEHTDAQVGRVVDALEAIDEFENTLFLYILGDNGASPEGQMLGTASEYHGWNGLPVTGESIMKHAGELGGPNSWPHYSAGWALAMDTPYQWMKQVASHYGGTRNGLIVTWPERIEASGEMRHQWHHVIDILPTILEAANMDFPTIVQGVPQSPIDGVSMCYSFNDAGAEGRHKKQYFEIGGSRAIYSDGWVACTVHRRTPWDLLAADPPEFADDEWELYHTDVDWSQSTNLANAHPAKLSELQDLFEAEAVRNQVFPLDDSAMAVRRNSPERASTTAMIFHGRAQRMPHDGIPNPIGKSFAIEARLSMARAPTGVVCVQGGQFTGYALYFSTAGVLNFCYNVGNRIFSYVRSDRPVSSRVKTVRFEFHADEQVLGVGGDGRLFVDGELAGRGRINRTASFMFPAGEDFCVGSDPLTPVTHEYDIFDNSFNGDIEFVRLSVRAGHEFSSAERRVIEESIQ